MTLERPRKPGQPGISDQRLADIGAAPNAPAPSQGGPAPLRSGSATRRQKPSLTFDARLAFNIDEAGVAIGVSRATIYRLVKAGELRTLRLGVRTVIRREVLAAYLDRHEQAA